LSYSPALGSKLFAGQQTLTVTFTPADADHNPVVHKSVTLTVNPAVAKITIGSLKQTHTGQPKPVTVTTVPPGLKVDLSYASATYPASASAPVNVGSYGVTATVNDPNGTGVKSGTLVINKGRQTITFPTLPTLHNGDPDYILPPYSSSGLAISYKSSALAVATIVDGNTLHIVGAGKVTLTASAPATANWLPAGVVSKTLTIGKRSQTIAFAAFSGHTVGEADFSPGATATSGLTVTYASASPAVATIMAGKIHLVGKGTVVITASQAGNTRWDVAAPIKQSLTVAGKPQTITFPTLADKGYGTADFAPGASASSALAVTYASSNPLVATIVSGRIHITGVGTTTVTAKQAGSALWAAADDATQTFTVIKGTPVITWAAPQAITYGTALTATQLNAKANVRGTLFVYDPALGSKLDAGIQTLRVTFTPADATRYNTALTSVPWVVNKGNQTISFASLPAVRAGDADVALTAKASSGLGVSFVSAAPAVATIVDGKIHVVGVGSTIVTASQPGDTNWNAALPAKQILTVKATAGTSLAALTVQAGDPEIRAFYAAMKNRIDAHDQDGVFALFAPDYLHQGRNLSDQFDDEPGLFDAVRTFAFDITGITVTGDHAVVSGVATFTSDTGAAAEIWAEPDTSDLSPGIGWLKMTPDGWRVSGDRQRAKVGAQAVHDATAGKESYTLELTADSSLAITSVSVSGPGIPDTALVPDPDNGGFTADIDGVLDPMPAEGSKYAFLIEFADGTRETYHDTVKSWEQPAPATTAHPSGEPEMVK
jgi:hypothetical protein